MVVIVPRYEKGRKWTNTHEAGTRQGYTQRVEAGGERYYMARGGSLFGDHLKKFSHRALIQGNLGRWGESGAKRCMWKMSSRCDPGRRRAARTEETWP